MNRLPGQGVPVPVGKEFPCPTCGKVLHGEASFARHKKQQHGSGPSPKGAASNVGRGQPAVSQTAGDVGSTPASGSFEPFYPSMDEWRKSRDEKAETKEERIAGGKPTGPSLQPVTLDLTSFWMAAGIFIDEHMPKDSRIRVDMNDKKADSLNKGLEQMGLVTLPAPTVVIPNWAPLLIAVATIFGIPIALMVKDFVGKVREDIKDRREKKKVEPAPVVVQAEGATAAVAIVPTNPGPQPYHEPGAE